jgi:biopolymer transport protein TolR
VRKPFGLAKVAEVQPDINVTPLVDVVLVLLIIFMVVAPRMDQDVQVELPGIFNPDPDVKVADPLKISMAKAGEYHLGEQTFTDIEALTAQLSVEHENDPMRRLALRGDQGLKYGEVRALLAKTQELGFPGMSFMVGERHRAGEPAASAPAAGGEVQKPAEAAAPPAAEPAAPGA